MRPLDLSLLNPPQRQAVVQGGGPLLVLAGAGSGKTRVLTHRVAHLIERGVPARAICALSFTNKAADEMRERIGHLVGKSDAEDLTLSTFHSLGLMILKQEKTAFGFPRGFTIYDGADQLGVVREILRHMQDADRRYDAKAILHRISRAKNAFTELDVDGAAIEGDEYDEITRLVWPRYQEALRAFAAVDFDDLLVETVRLIDRDEGVRERWTSRWLHLLVDEYQDTNSVQLELVNRLCARHANVTVVGDDDQSIYGWRGALASNILDFERSFPGARIVKLEQNYRSTPAILAAANAVIKNNSQRHDKALWSDGPCGDPVVSVACADADAEARFVADEIEMLRQDDRRRYRDCAILYRSNLQSRAFEEELRSRRIPLVMHGGQQFYERKEVKDIIAYLKVALSPRDELSLRRIVNYPARGIGAATIAAAAKSAQAERIPLWDALIKTGKPQVATFVALIERLRAGLALKPAEAARTLVEEVGIVDDIRAASPSNSAAQRRIANITELLVSLDAQQARKGGPDAMRDYLNFISLNRNDEDDDDDDEASNDQVTMTTLHGAKGLEWPVVFLVGLEEELLPHARTLYPQGPDVVDGELADVSEERRLAYVGITRARERLYLTRAFVRNKHGKDRLRTASRFLMEIPSEHIAVRDLAAEARKPVAKADLAGFFAKMAKD